MPITDMSIPELNAHLEDMATRVGPIWWGTVEYCRLFPHAAFRPKRLYMKTDLEDSISCAYCYSERVACLLFKVIDILGPLQSSVHDLEPLLRKAHIAIIHYTRQNDLEQFCQYKGISKVHPQGADVVLNLADTFEQYIDQLGQRTRKHMQYYVRKLEKEWRSDLRVAFYARSEIPLELILKLVTLNRDRLKAKGQKSHWTDELAERAWKISQHKGLLCAVFHKDEFVAGTLSYLHLNDGYFILIGHDLRYDRLNLGKVALWFTLQSLIAMKVKKFYMHYGHNPYKLLLGGQSEPVYKVVIFRNRLIHAFWSATHMYKTAILRARRHQPGG